VTGVGERPAAVRRWPQLRALAAALTFLTRIPLGRWVLADADDLARAGPAFPLVGAGIGAAVGATAAALAHALSPLLAVSLALALGAALTGALHLDALADTADALGARTREHALAIMRDHTIGAYGAVAILLDLLIKAAALATLVGHAHVVRLAIAAGALSRMTPVLLSAALPYARSSGGLGEPLTGGGRRRAAAASLVALAIAVGAGGVDGAILGGCALAVAIVAWCVLRRWLGGVTGDALGATVELTEALTLVLAVALVGGAR
jgi:adenosylcobinamide-GDP ribazoletransferase